jgi:hypothetical protein
MIERAGEVDPTDPMSIAEYCLSCAADAMAKAAKFRANQVSVGMFESVAGAHRSIARVILQAWGVDDLDRLWDILSERLASREAAD